MPLKGLKYLVRLIKGAETQGALGPDARCNFLPEVIITSCWQHDEVEQSFDALCCTQKHVVANLQRANFCRPAEHRSITHMCGHKITPITSAPTPRPVQRCTKTWCPNMPSHSAKGRLADLRLTTGDHLLFRILQLDPAVHASWYLSQRSTPAIWS